MVKVSWLITDQNVTVNYNGETHIVKRTDALADRLIKAVKSGDTKSIPNLVSAAQRIEKQSNGQFKVVNGQVFIDGQAAPEVLSRKIVTFSNEGLPFQPLVKFAKNLQLNPSFRAVNELFQFLEKNDHPITEDGNFIAYKRVRENFKDIHSNTMDNSVGNVLEVPRNQVDEDSSRTCSHGLHVANWDYAHTQFASSNPETDIMLEVEVNPADVVAIPADYNQSKMRVCKYKVLGVVQTPFDAKESLRCSSVNANASCDECDEDGEDYESSLDSLLKEEEEEDSEVYYCMECGEECEDSSDFCSECSECEDQDSYPWEDELF